MSSSLNPISRSSRRINVGITIGDPSGIGPFITLEALKAVGGAANFIVIGDNGVLSRFGKLPGSVEFFDLKNVDRRGFRSGVMSAEYGRCSLQYLEKAVELLKAGSLDCLVTCPVSKEAISLSGASGFFGHTEYLAERFGIGDYVMMLLNRRLKVSLVTRHVPLASVPSKITVDALQKTVVITEKGLRVLFGITKPRIGVLGLNPHASDNGIIGREEVALIRPAIERLKNDGMALEGPESADVVVHKAYAGGYDAVIAMYHDQALIPLKLSGGSRGVNLTLGLPFVRTSPLHGTAYDIAGTKKASPDSLIEAIRLCIKCARNLKNA